MNLKQLSLVELKALAYDYFVQIDLLQKEFQLINQELYLRQNNKVQEQENVIDGQTSTTEEVSE